MKRGIPAHVLVERLNHVLTQARLEATAGQVSVDTINEAQNVLRQLREAI